jgi:hypothetical protein
MDTITITDPTDQCFPFSRVLFEDPRVLYHGTWSMYSSRIDTDGFVQVKLPFDHEHVATIMRARAAIGWESYAPVFFGE